MEREILRNVFTFFLVLSACAQPAEFVSDIEQKNAELRPALRQVFTAGRSVSNELSFSFLPDAALQNLQLKALPPEAVTLQQMDRPRTIDQFTQGHRGSFVKEDFTVATLDKLDLLLVVDDSSSMGPYQDELSKGLSSLLSHISNTDWRIMVTTTSAFRRRNPADPTKVLELYGCPRVKDSSDKFLITRDDYVANPQLAEERFAWKVQIGESGDPIERGLLAAVSSLQGFSNLCSRDSTSDARQEWTRADSHKVVLVLTDEENCGSDRDQDCGGEDDASPQFFLDRAPAKTQLFALLHDLDRYAQCEDQDYVRKPDDYRQLIAATGGMEGNICEDSYDETLQEISRNMHPIARKDYALAHAPEAQTLEFWVDGRPWDCQFSLDNGNVFVESSLPPQAKVLSIGYRHGPEPMRRTFPLSTSVDPATLSVTVNGSVVPPESYSIVDGSLLFSNEPPELAKISFEYRIAQPLPQLFPLSKEALLDTVRVSVNGTPISDFQIVGSEQFEIYLPRVPSDGAAIVVSYETTGGRTLRYPALPIAPEQILEINAVDSVSRAPIVIERDGSNLVFQEADIQDQRSVEIRYALKSESNELALDLPQSPKEGTLAVAASSTGTDCVANVANEGNRLRFPCSPAMLGHLLIRYDYISDVDNSFAVNGRFTRDAVWKVKVNGTETKDFERNDSRIIFPEGLLDADDVIEVEVQDLILQ